MASAVPPGNSVGKLISAGFSKLVERQLPWQGPDDELPQLNPVRTQSKAAHASDKTGYGAIRF
jgi:hypothetical protein